MDLAPELRTFLHVATRGSLSGAARHMGVPRSTVSRRLDRLEDHLGERLFVRTTRSLRLTDAGDLLLERAAPVLQALDTLVDDVRELAGTPQGSLRVSVPPGLGEEFLAEFLVAFRQHAPHVRLDVVASSRPPNLLVDGFDIALRDDVLEDSPWLRHPVGPADRLAVASKGYLEEHGLPRTLEELADHQVVAVLTAREDTTWPLRNGQEVSVEPVLRANDWGTLCRAVKAGMGIGLLPFYTVAVELVDGTMHTVLPSQIGSERTLVALFPPGRRRSPKIRAFLDFMDQFTTQVREKSGIQDPRENRLS